MHGSRQYWWQLLFVCGVALVCRLLVLSLRQDSLHTDVDAYLEIAKHLASGDGFSRGQPSYPTAYRPPLYPLLIWAILKLGGGAMLLGIVQAVLGTITVGLTYRVGRLLNLGLGSLLAALLVAVDPLLLQYTVLPMTEVLCVTLVMLWCWIACEWYPAGPNQQSGTFMPSLLQGVTLGLLCLCRPAFLLAALVIVVAMTVRAFHEWRSRREDRATRFTFGPVVLTMVGLVLVIAPWTIRNAVVIGKATPATTHGGYTLLLANNPVFYREVVSQPWGTTWQRDSLLRWQADLEQQMSAAGIAPHDEVARDRWMYRQAQSYIRSEPGLFIRACVWRGLRFWDVAPWQTGGHSRYLVWGTALFYGLLTCGMLAALWHLRRGEWKLWGWLLLLPLLLWATHLVYWTDMRMRAPVIPILALLAARGCLGRQNPSGLPAKDPSSVE